MARVSKMLKVVFLLVIANLLADRTVREAITGKAGEFNSDGHGSPGIITAILHQFKRNLFGGNDIGELDDESELDYNPEIDSAFIDSYGDFEQIVDERR